MILTYSTQFLPVFQGILLSWGTGVWELYGWPEWQSPRDSTTYATFLPFTGMYKQETKPSWRLLRHSYPSLRHYLGYDVEISKCNWLEPNKADKTGIALPSCWLQHIKNICNQMTSQQSDTLSPNSHFTLTYPHYLHLEPHMLKPIFIFACSISEHFLWLKILLVTLLVC
jgi:hypothetical protein